MATAATFPWEGLTPPAKKSYCCCCCGGGGLTFPPAFWGVLLLLREGSTSTIRGCHCCSGRNKQQMGTMELYVSWKHLLHYMQEISFHLSFMNKSLYYKGNPKSGVYPQKWDLTANYHCETASFTKAMKWSHIAYGHFGSNTLAYVYKEVTCFPEACFCIRCKRYTPIHHLWINHSIIRKIWKVGYTLESEIWLQHTKVNHRFC